MDDIDILDSIFNSMDAFFSFLDGVSITSLLNTYWFLFFMEFPRYYLLEIIIVLYYMFRNRAYRKSRERAHFQLLKENPLVSILVPGKNEGRHIYKLLQSLNEQTYRNYEVVIVDDGSDDDTPLICEDLKRKGLIHTYLRLKMRGGKASAANCGAYYARGKYVIHMDADSSLDRDAIEKILIPFYLDPMIKAVGGCVKVRNNKDSVCTSLQAIEYLKTIMVGRIVTDTLGIYHVISGAFGAFDADVLRQIGYWDIGPGLDGDITQKIRKAGWKVHFAQEAVCLTSVPVRWHRLFHQRLRWAKSLIRFRVRKHKDIFMPNRNFSVINFFSNFENIFYDLFLDLLWILYIITMLVNQIDRIWEIFFLGYFIRICFAVISFIVVLLVTERKREELFLIKFLPLLTFYTGYFLRITRSIAYFAEFFFFSSYRDEWNPRKTSIYARIEKL